MTPRNILIYGSGGVGKSTRIAEAIEYVARKYGKRSRVVGADGGGTTSAIAHLLEDGTASYWPIDQWEEGSRFDVLDKATKGWWPVDPETPNSPLLEPFRESKPCPLCNGESGAKGLTMVPSCTSCGKPFPAGTVIRVKREPINGMEEVGLLCFEGMTAFGDLLLDRLKKADTGGGRSIRDGTFVIAAPGQQHYGDAQSYLGQYIRNSRLIPVPLVIWTALELKSEEDGKPLYGPKGPGKALTSLCIPWFTDVIHLDLVHQRDPKNPLQIVKDKEGQEVVERKFYLAPHFPPDNAQFKFAAKTSAPLIHGMPSVMKADMALFFEEGEKATLRAAQARKA